MAFGGVSLDSSIKKVTFQEADAGGLTVIVPVVKLLAEANKLRVFDDNFLAGLINHT